MVSLEAVRASKARIKSDLASKLVAVFIGATSGIGEISLKHFAKSTLKPRIYFTGRRRACGLRIQEELQKLNPDGEYIYFEHDSSLIHNVDALCRDIAAEETTINFLVISIGTLISGTREYTLRHGFDILLPHTICCEPTAADQARLCRVMTVFAGSKEGPIHTDDSPALRLPVYKARGHIVSMITLTFEHIHKQAPEVSFIHDYPGFVNTGMSRELKPTVVTTVMKGFFRVIGERQLFNATSARFPPQTGDANGVRLGEGLKTATSTEGEIGGGVYSIDNVNESAGQSVVTLLSKLRKEGVADDTWKHTEAEFQRVAGSSSI
ncbi:hypothetical protein GGR57DRAFT_520963 [Xylariaceae sp. FL1272]|nr:hypothetical protein GGR57DRAFT_520963 [Xylariaceae sp. FL1272]